MAIKLKFIMILFLNLGILISTNNDCGTPIECYANAISKLEDARKELRETENKLKMIIQQFESKIEQNFGNLDSKVNKNWEDTEKNKQVLNEKIDRNFVDSQSKYTELGQQINAIKSQPKAFSDLEFKGGCDGNGMVDCYCPEGKKLISGGCNSSGIAEASQMGPNWYRCRGNGGINVRILCARIPY